MTIDEARLLQKGDSVHVHDKRKGLHLVGRVVRAEWDSITRTIHVSVKLATGHGFAMLGNLSVEKLHRAEDCQGEAQTA